MFLLPRLAGCKLLLRGGDCIDSDQARDRTDFTGNPILVAVAARQDGWPRFA